MIAGEVKGNGIADVINYIITKGKPGILHVECRALKGRIYLSDWIIVGAETTNALAEDAFMEIYLADTLKFHFEETYDIKRNISMTFKELVSYSSKGSVRHTIEMTDIIRSTGAVKGSDIADPIKGDLIEKTAEGMFLCDLIARHKGTRAELIDVVCELAADKAVSVRKTQSLKELFLFPKNASMKLDEYEINVFRLIYSGMPVADLICKAGLTPCDLADKLTWMVVKNTLTISDLGGKVVEPMAVRDLLFLTKTDCKQSLMAKSDRSFGSRQGQIRVDTLQILFWNQALLGQKPAAVKVETKLESLTMSFDAGKNLQGRVAMNPNDMDRLGLFEGDDVTCQPLEGEI